MDVTGVFKRIVHELEVRPDPEGNLNGGGELKTTFDGKKNDKT